MASCSSPNDAIRLETAFIRHIQVLILSGTGFAELYLICVIPLLSDSCPGE